MVGSVETANGGLTVVRSSTPQPVNPADLIPNPAISVPEVPQVEMQAAPPQQEVAANAVLADQGIGANVNSIG